MLMQFVLHNWSLFLALFAILGMLAYKPVIQAMYGIKNLLPPQAVQVMNRDDGIVVDVCEPAEYTQGHIVNAINLPLSALPKRVGELDRYRSRPVIVSCRSGNRSVRGALILRKHGFEKVYSLAGGITAWQRDNLPVER
jgi:rhodanese-related sulfurtransferase